MIRSMLIVVNAEAHGDRVLQYGLQLSQSLRAEVEVAYLQKESWKDIWDRLNREKAKFDCILIDSGDPEATNDPMSRLRERLIDQLTIPVLVVPRNGSFPAIRHMVFGSNFEHLHPVDSQALLSLAHHLSAQFSCVHVDPLTASWPEMPESAFELRYDLPEGKEQAVQFFFVRSENVQQGLTTFLNQQKADLLILMHHNHTLPTQPGLSLQMIQEVQIPLLIVHTRSAD